MVGLARVELTVLHAIRKPVGARYDASGREDTREWAVDPQAMPQICINSINSLSPQYGISPSVGVPGCPLVSKTTSCCSTRYTELKDLGGILKGLSHKC